MENAPKLMKIVTWIPKNEATSQELQRIAQRLQKCNFCNF